MAETQPWYYCLLLFLVHESGLLFEAVEERTGQDCSSSQCNMGLRVVQLPKHYDMCLDPDVHIYIPQRPNLDQFSDTSNLVRCAFAHSRLMLVQYQYLLTCLPSMITALPYCTVPVLEARCAFKRSAFVSLTARCHWVCLNPPCLTFSPSRHRRIRHL